MQNSRYAFIILCTALFIDAVGLGIMFPILTPLILNAKLSILDPATSVNSRNLLYGITLSAFPLGLFFSAPILGDLSDSLGRRKILIFAIIGVAISYAASAVAVWQSSIGFLIFSRFFAGLVSGSQPIAQAAIMDISPPEKKAKNLSWIFFFCSSGFFIGPLLGGWLSDSTLSPYFNLTTPLWAAVALCFLCGIGLIFGFKETVLEKRAITLQPLRGFKVIGETMTNKHINLLLVSVLLTQLSWSCFFQIIPAYLTEHLAFSPQQIAHYVSIISIGFAVAFCGAIDWLGKRFAPLKVARAAILFSFFCLLAANLLPSNWLMWSIAAPLGFASACTYTLSLTIASNRVDPAYQGWLMGAAMGMISIAWFLTPMIGGILMNAFSNAPLIFSAILMLAAWLVLKKDKG